VLAGETCFCIVSSSPLASTAAHPTGRRAGKENKNACRWPEYFSGQA
jgi:hypothetical protein